MAKDRIVLSNNLSSECSSKRVLNIMLICCEENHPYGPAEATAQMFLELEGTGRPPILPPKNFSRVPLSGTQRYRAVQLYR
eukprot:scaffold78590_cov48-Cyclotella_meneghiniana.AAC.1